jgi:hypothetical protein
MDPNNNQPLGANTAQQPINAQPMQSAESVPPTPAPAPVATPQPTPVTPPPPTPETMPEPTAMPESPKGKGGKVVMLLVILLLLIAGMVTYVLYARNQMKITEEKASQNKTVVIPSPVLSPTLAPQEKLEVSSPEADLQDIEKDVQGL